ncbi:unnamed protein product [Owenia fusiformis]|uniref:Major facilitator superfamily (MFS) profile domain-containing protein n=1 Tax=Owenia fusiformis TaxID=6347 RepID=A0A8S4N0U8_OWEFU|nr:unnamed protein product [Owenia fusiformis]
MKFDEVFEITGHFGPYQLVLYILLGIVGIPNGYQNLATTFIGGKQDHWCKIPELSNLTHNQQKVVGIPLIRESDGNVRYDQCFMFNLSYSSYTHDELINWNRTVQGIDDSTPKLKCTSWVWDQSQYQSTILSEWDLVCDRAPLVPLLSTIYIFGMFVGGVSSGALSDRFGRKKVFLIGLFLETVFALIGAFATSYAFLAVIRFLVSVSAAAAFTTTFVLIMECIGPKARVYCGVLYQAFFSLGFALLPLMAYFIRDFRKLQIAMAIPPIILQVYWFIIPESPRWLVSKGRHEEAIEILKNVAKVNKKTLPEKLTFDTEEDGQSTDNKEVAMREFHSMKSTEKMVPDSTEVKGTVLDLFRTPRLRCRTFNIWFNWFVNSMVYYGLSLNTGSLSGDIYTNTTLSALVEFPALLLAAVALDRVNRRWPLGLTMITGGAACLACIPLLYRKKDLGAVLNTISMIGKLMLSASFAIIYVFSAELYPTCIRNVGVGSASTAARVSGMASPFIGRLNEFWPPIPSIIFGVFSLAAGFLAFLLPETKDKKLPETLEEGERFGLEDDTEPFETLGNGQINQGFKDDVGLRPLSVGDDKPKMVTQL